MGFLSDWDKKREERDRVAIEYYGEKYDFLCWKRKQTVKNIVDSKEVRSA
jgi:hypothetical protein